jgi:serine/threonine protein kinase
MTEQDNDMTQRIGDRYEIRGLLGSGGMADVYLAHDAHLMRDIALKILRFDPSLDAKQMEEQKVRLLREARAAARLSHPGIVVIHDLGESRGRSFISMEYIQGRNLRELYREQLERGYGLPVGTILSMARQVAAALDYAHGQNVIHRDIKPENIMVTPDGTCKITDFGIARSYVAGLRTLTPHGKLVCTYHYAAPEYFQGGDASARGDQFSLGCVLYELLTGRFAFGGDEMHQVWYRITQVTPVPPSDIAFDLPESVNPVILKMLAKTPDTRYGTCGEAVKALESALSGFDPETAFHVQPDDAVDDACPDTHSPETGDMADLSVWSSEITKKSGNRILGTDLKNRGTAASDDAGPGGGKDAAEYSAADSGQRTKRMTIGRWNRWWMMVVAGIIFVFFAWIYQQKLTDRSGSAGSGRGDLGLKPASPVVVVMGRTPEIGGLADVLVTPGPGIVETDNDPVGVPNFVTATPSSSPEPSATITPVRDNTVRPVLARTRTPAPGRTATPVRTPTPGLTVILTPARIPGSDPEAVPVRVAVTVEPTVTPSITPEPLVTITPEVTVTVTPSVTPEPRKREPWVPF